MEPIFWVWIGIIIATAVIEFVTLDLASIWFTAGAIIPLILSIVGGVHWAIQVAVFFVVSIALILSLRRLTRKFLLRNAKEKTNLDALVGNTYKLLTRTSDDDVGTLKVNGVIWNVTGKDGQTIEAGEKVQIVKVEGSKFIVEKAETKKEN